MAHPPPPEEPRPAREAPGPGPAPGGDGLAPDPGPEAAVRGAFRHLPGIGPVREARLRALGVRTWGDLGPRPLPGLRLGTASWQTLLDGVARCDQAWDAADIGFFARGLCGPDLWRVLAAYGERAAFVDIETDGLGAGARITVIACLWKGRLYTYVRDENLEEFPELLRHFELMVTYNGTGFDVPMIVRGFHIPELPCSHVDLRRVCHHAGRHGGLKSVEAQLGLRRPPDLAGVDGAQAAAMWQRWKQHASRPDRDLLVRYCAADAVALRGVAGALLRAYGCRPAMPEGDSIWDELNEALPPPAAPPSEPMPAPGRAPGSLGPPAGTAAGAAPAAVAAPGPEAPGTPQACPEGDGLGSGDTRRRLRELLRRRFALGGPPRGEPGP